ncbi:MAG: NAD-dependent dihydropyrimidine dehydrogenase subunit PreA [Candidatus Thermoplasmatota archaeon]|jgi:dihydropyrimidine dehydrogenase (NAD+) subunit PreA|nr:NAD-dependent dihydropyrimidine dehydrogenase subunit PreA [Candidatus Thermoplasmatota archaeon]MDP7265206.1 NAD-dependent dihydropyrimidine dehydrogenase subunit PreA [Candidatus Thermoplasmatota archaeon]
MYRYRDLSVELCGVRFENPFVLAAAPPTDELDMVRRAFRMGWAGAVLKTTHVEDAEVDLVYPMMSSVNMKDRRVAGLGNIDLISHYGIEVVEERVRSLKEEFPEKVVMASIMGSRKEEWQELVMRLEEAGVDMIECSFSCPQGSMGERSGAMLGQDGEASKKVAAWVKSAAKRVPVVIKITPQVAFISEIVQMIKEGGADAVCASNTIPSLMGIDLETLVPYPNVRGKSTYSGLSGSLIKPITLRTIAEIKKNVDIPITGTGGVMNWKDAVELMLVGASNVQLCTAVMHYGYGIIDDLIVGLSNYLETHDFASPMQLIGKSLPHIASHDLLERNPHIKAHVDDDKCVRCGLCHIACRDGGHQAIDFDIDSRLALVDEDKCVGCRLCRTVCPVGDCISMRYL